MADRIYDRQLKCGCLISSDGGGGLIPCHYGYGCGKDGCDEHNECDECIEERKLCAEAWDEWKKTYDYKLHEREVIERNNSDKYLKEIIIENTEVKKLFEETGGIPDYLEINK
jgi:hypothetical protein